MLEQQLLFFVAKKASLHGTFSSSTTKIALELGISQQSVSRKLRQLQEQGLIELSASPKGVKVKLSPSGISKLKEHHLELKGLFESKPAQKIQGIVKIGLGEGAYYVSRPQYVKQFKKLLGFKPYPGTLNLIVDEDSLAPFLSSREEIKIRGFKTKKRSFGPITAFKVLVEGKAKGALIFPERSSHPSNEIEVISPAYLRGKFKLKEGSKVRLFNEK